MRKMLGCLVVICLLAALSGAAAAKQSESTDNGYNFTAVRTVLVTTPALTFGGWDVSGNNRFVRYDAAAGKIAALLNAKLKKAVNLRYVTLDYVTERIKADPELECDPQSPEFADLLRREIPKYADLVLYLTVRDFGWFHEYKAAYEAWETKTDRVRYRGKGPDGKAFEGWIDVEKEVLVYHPPRYEIYDSAEASFALVMPQTGRYVWSYSDVRSRPSFRVNSDYDHSGPESMMNRIFDEAMDRMPIYPKQSPVLSYN